MKKIDDEKFTIYIDIDETITFDEGKSFVEKAIFFIKKYSDKANIIIWSQGGYDYANTIVDKANIRDYIVAVLPKPDIIIDDLKFSQFTSEFYPSWEKIDRILEKCNN